MASPTFLLLQVSLSLLMMWARVMERKEKNRSSGGAATEEREGRKEPRKGWTFEMKLRDWRQNWGHILELSWIAPKSGFTLHCLSRFAASYLPFPMRSLNYTLRIKSQVVEIFKKLYSTLIFNHQDSPLIFFHSSSAGLEEYTNSGRRTVSPPIFFPLLLVLVINASAVFPSGSEITSETSRISRLLFKGKSTYCS